MINNKKGMYPNNKKEDSRKNEDLSSYKNQLNSLKISLNYISKIGGKKLKPLILKDRVNKKLNLSLNKDENNKSFNNISNDKINYKYKINTQVENIRNKLYENPKITRYDTIIADNPKYYLHVLNKKFINDLKLYINSKNNIRYKMASPKNRKNNQKSKKIYDDLNIKELQKLYNEIEHNDFQKAESDFHTINKNNINKNNIYNYETYASNKNIFNHPKLYILDLKEKNNNKLPKINNKINEMSIKLEYETKKSFKIRFQKLYFNEIFKMLQNKQKSINI